MTAATIASSPGQSNLLQADVGAEYDEVITIDLSALEPHINGYVFSRPCSLPPASGSNTESIHESNCSRNMPLRSYLTRENNADSKVMDSPFTPDLSTPLSQFKDAVKVNKWPETFGAGLIGSCTNSSYQDMTRAEDLVKQASAAGLEPKADFFITPGSEQIRATLSRDWTLDTFSSAGGTVLANACGPCIGQWKRTGKWSQSLLFLSCALNRAARFVNGILFSSTLAWEWKS